MNKLFLFLLAGLICLPGSSQSRALNKALSQSPKAYALYSADGTPIPWSEAVERSMMSDVVLFGELHDDGIMHWLQCELIRDLVAEGAAPLLGAEMFESDDQLVVNEYLDGIINEDKLEAAANLWPNHHTDYQPILDLAKEHDLDFIATNVPRRYASYVYRNGLDVLSELSQEALAFLPPLPVAFDPSLPGYQAMLEMGGGHGGETLLMAQAIKDATMAHFIASSLRETGPFVHFNGAYHSQNREGIVWYLKQSNPELQVLTIHGTTQADVSVPDTSVLGIGDILLITNERITRTH